jgi:hypothetical protein
MMIEGGARWGYDPNWVPIKRNKLDTAPSLDPDEKIVTISEDEKGGPQDSNSKKELISV